MSTLKDAFRRMQDQSDGFNWYWLSYGEKCYAYAVVEAVPWDEDATEPPSGGMLKPHPDKDDAWLAEDGTEMMIMEYVVTCEQPRGGAVCEFIAAAYRFAEEMASGRRRKPSE